MKGRPTRRELSNIYCDIFLSFLSPSILQRLPLLASCQERILFLLLGTASLSHFLPIANLLNNRSASTVFSSLTFYVFLLHSFTIPYSLSWLKVLWNPEQLICNFSTFRRPTHFFRLTTSISRLPATTFYSFPTSDYQLSNLVP